jgi:hypothetical protein
MEDLIDPEIDNGRVLSLFSYAIIQPKPWAQLDLLCSKR